MKYSDFLKKTKNMTPQQVAEQIYGIPYQEAVAKILWSQDTVTSSGERILETLENQLQYYLLQNNHNLVEKVTNENAMNVSGGEFKWWDGKWIFQEWAPREVQKRDEKTRNFTNSTTKELKITRDWTTENIKIINNIIKDNDLAYPYTAIQLPKSYRKISRKDLYVGKQFAKHKEDRSFNPNLDREQSIDKDFIILAQRSHRPEEIPWYEDGINARNNDTDTSDIVRECLKQGMAPMDIDQSMLLWELIKDSLGEEYVDFNWHGADSDETGYEDIRKKYQEIDKLLWTQFHYFDRDEKPKNWHQYIMRDYGVYINPDWSPQGFLRGDFRSDDSALGGVASVRLRCYLGYSSSAFGFRPCG